MASSFSLKGQNNITLLKSTYLPIKRCNLVRITSQVKNTNYPLESLQSGVHESIKLRRGQFNEGQYHLRPPTIKELKNIIS